MPRHCPVTGLLLGRCECGACDDIDYDATTGGVEGDLGTSEDDAA